MAKKYFQQLPSWIVGLILIIGAMLDGIAISSIIEHNQTLSIVSIVLRSGINEFRQLYNYGVVANVPPLKTDKQ